MSNMDTEIREFVKENYILTGEVTDLDADQSLTDLGIIDSIGVFALVDFIEQSYGVVVADDEMTPENLDSINRIVAFVTKKKNQDNRTAA